MTTTPTPTDAEKIAAAKDTAFELGIHAFLKNAGVTAAEDHETFIAIAKAVASQE